MATKKRKKTLKKRGKILKRKREVLDKRKKNPERDLAKALYDLNKIFTSKELSRKFRIKPWQVSKYKKYRKRKPFNKKKRERILKFYDKLQRMEKGEDFRYHYRVITKKRRIVPSIKIPASRINELIERIGIKKLAREMRVKPETIKKWQKGRFIRLGLKAKEKLYRTYREYLKRLVGLFFLQEAFLPKHKRRRKAYCYIKYYKTFFGTKNEFKNYIEDKEYFRLQDSLIGERGRFNEVETGNFLNYLNKVRQTGDESLLRRSIEDCREFIAENFKGKGLRRLLKKVKKYEK